MNLAEEKEVLAEHVRGWLRAGLMRTGWSAEEWARRAGVAATTITRTMNSRDLVPNFYSLWKLARVAGLPLPDGARPVVPLVDWASYVRHGIDGSFVGHGEIWSPERHVRLAVRLDRKDRRFAPGDIVFLRPVPTDAEIGDGFFVVRDRGAGRLLAEVRGPWALPLDDDGVPRRLGEVEPEARIVGAYRPEN